ncbi:MAG TPA: hypothetical protein QKA08_05260 [Candidatus Megaira endosymbiont of Nemacystus decipiens]|nr:hypothetical protein [Candidatus Megaera endosymbiont of Nemacystus decipiens]
MDLSFQEIVSKQSKKIEHLEAVARRAIKFSVLESKKESVDVNV